MNQPNFTSLIPPCFSAAVRLTGLMLILAATACQSLRSASVTIKNQPADRIAYTTAKVFNAEGYRGGMSGPGQMVFEKEASYATTLSRDGYYSARDGSRTINRVRVSFEHLGGSEYRLQCQAFMVTGGSDPFFQDEVPLAAIRHAPYQTLLNQVVQELQ